MRSKFQTLCLRGLSSDPPQTPTTPSPLRAIKPALAATDGRGLPPQQQFWVALVVPVPVTLLPARLVRRAEPIDISSCLISTFAGRSNLVRRPNSGACRAAWRKTARRSSATTSRKPLFGGAWSPSSSVRRTTRARLCLPAQAERVLFERAQDRGRLALRLRA